MFVVVCLLIAILTTDAKRQYEHQFPNGSEHLTMPRTLFYSLYMGAIKYKFFDLTLESMRWNPNVTFVMINVIEENSDQADEAMKVVKKWNVPNFKLHVISIPKFTARVKEKLEIDVPFTPEWYYKLCDYKPTLAHLFPEMFEVAPGELPYKFWGYGDTDVVWGSFKRFAHWFQGDYTFIVSGWWGTTGAAAFYPNEDWSRKLFMDDPKYIPLLKDKDYHNLDEGGTQTNQEWVVDSGSHSISEIQKRRMSSNNTRYTMNRSNHWKDHCFVDQNSCHEWVGPVSWVRGSLKILHGSPEFPPGREILFFHRPETKVNIPKRHRDAILQDMMEYGYLMPNWIPLLTRFACKKSIVYSSMPTLEAMHKYQPYQESCFMKDYDKIESDYIASI